MILRRFLIVASMISSALAMSQGTQAQPAPDTQLFVNPLAYVGGDGNIYLADLNTRASVPITDDSAREYFQTTPFFRTTRNYGQIRWSQDGARIAFVDRVSGAVFIAPAGERPRQISSALTDRNYPIAWSPDGAELAIVARGDGLSRQILAVSTATLPGETLRTAGTFTESVDCGQGLTNDPAERLYRDEDTRFAFAWTSRGFLRFSECEGALILSNPLGATIWRVENLTRVAIAANGDRIAVIRRDPTSGQTGLATLDPETGMLRLIHVQFGLDQIAWADDAIGTILFSDRVSAPADQPNPASPVGAAIFPGLWPLVYTHSAVSLWSVPSGGGIPNRLYDGEGYGIGAIAPVPGGGGVAFTVITSSRDIVRAINRGSPVQQAVKAAPQNQLWYRPNIAGTGAVQIAPGGRVAYGRGPYIARIGAQGPGALDPAAILSIGGPALVTILSADTLNLREGPGMTSRTIRPLKSAEVVDVIGGPRYADGGRWWPVRTFDRLTGWALDRTTISGQQVINLRPLATGIVINISVDKRSIRQGECITLTWQVQGAISISLNGRDIAFAGSEVHCPAQTSPYIILALGSDGALANGFFVNVTTTARG